MTGPIPLYTAHPIYDRFHWLEPIANAMVEAGVGPVDYLRSPRIRKLGRLWAKAQLNINVRYGDRAFLGVVAHGSGARCFPAILTNEVIPVGMDCWEPIWPRWETMLRRGRARAAVFTARQCAEEMASRVDGLKTLWLPEGIQLEQYPKGPPLAERSIDVLQIGRRFDPLHVAIEGPLAREGFEYVYPTEGWLFPDHAQMVAGLRDTKCLICYPRCDTHPEKAGRVETLTLRYLEGFATGCIVVGRSPRELIDLFGYDPVVALEPGEGAASRLIEILRDVESFQELIERNREAVERLGPWRASVDRMLGELRGLGYAPAAEVQSGGAS